MTALLTAFAPFGRWRVNSSEAAARLLEGRPGLRVAVLPVDHAAACDALAAAVAATRPAALLLTGLADEPRLRLELLARRPAGRSDGLAQARGVWPWAAALDAVRAAGAPIRLSRDAGRYVCETSYWRAATAPMAARVAFLHVPPLGPAWPAERVAAAVAACLAAGGATNISPCNEAGRGPG